MLETLHRYIQEKADVPLGEGEFELIGSYFISKIIRKRQYFLQEGDLSKSIAFVSKGCLRLYKFDKSGIKHIRQFAIENWWICDRESAVNKTPSTYNIDAIEDSELLLIDFEKTKELSLRSPVFANLVAKVSLRNFIALEKRVHVAICYNAEEKYFDFLKTYPGFINRIPLHMIASFLGITPETLSRIRRQHIALQ